MPATADKRATFRKMHESGCFVLPNPFDVGSAKALQRIGFKAIASTSAGFAWSIGKSDNRVTLDEVCEHLTALCAAVDLPVNADFEGGFAHEPEKVGANVARAVKTGVAGLSIEDSTGDAAKPLYEPSLAIARIKAARAAIDADDSGVLLTGRCEGFLVGQADLAMVIDRLNAYSEAGADCLYAPGIRGRRSRGTPHQRRRFAGAHRMERLHARGTRDRGNRNVHRIGQRLFRRRLEQDVFHLAATCRQVEFQDACFECPRQATGYLVSSRTAAQPSEPAGSPAPRPSSLPARCWREGSRRACPEALRETSAGCSGRSKRCRPD
jgi:Phosphoenolpyruvate phosphomutase